MSGDDGAEFFALEGMGADREPLVVSRAAFQMHSFGLVRSLKDGHPGFVGDDYLDAITADSTSSMLELEAAGVWRRCDGGYVLLDRAALEQALDMWERVRELDDEGDDG